MLEALHDIGIVSRLVGVNDDNDESFDEKYMKLHISPLPHNCMIIGWLRSLFILLMPLRIRSFSFFLHSPRIPW